ncbi:hypothetical protein [Nocardioides aquiterrae]|uniref:DUF952 domain-containing protein n=1 Tax=Nocardioides aquiterrae TaxID=203799 RepID=A0ABN1UJ39_9ACTN
MPFTSDDVPPGPYFHGTRRSLAVGTALRPDTVNPSDGDDRRMVWATTDPKAALEWARLRYPLSGDTLFVYEVDLVDPEVDTNHHRDWETGPFVSVMAPAGTVTSLVLSDRQRPDGDASR